MVSWSILCLVMLDGKFSPAGLFLGCEQWYSGPLLWCDGGTRVLWPQASSLDLSPPSGTIPQLEAVGMGTCWGHVNKKIQLGLVEAG